MGELSWAAVRARRMTRQGLGTEPYDGGPADVVRAMCGAHAQVMPAAELSVGLRLAAATRDDVRAALWDERVLVKTIGMRGTVHLFASGELAMWTAALSAVPASSPFPPGVRLTDEQADAVVAAIGKALADAELTVDELGEAVVDLAGSWAGDLVMPAFQDLWPRWRQAIGTAAARGALCFGPDRGRKVTYTSPRRWVRGFEPADPDAALADVVRRYLRAYGPATPEHFARWFGAPRRWAADALDRLGDELEQVVVAGNDAWQLAGEGDPGDDAVEGVRLLPYFDAYVIAAQPRELLFPGRAAERALARGQAGNYPVLLVDGEAAGVWHLRRSGRRSTVTVEPLRRLTAARRKALDEQVARIAEFSAGPAELVIGEIAVGPHA